MRHAGSAGATVTELFPHDVLNESFSHAIWTQLSSRALPNRPPACPSPHVRCRDDGSINSGRSSRSPAHSSLTELTASLETVSTGSPRRRRLCSTTVSLCRQPRPSPVCSEKVFAFYSLRCCQAGTTTDACGSRRPVSENVSLPTTLQFLTCRLLWMFSVPYLPTTLDVLLTRICALGIYIY